MSYNKNNTFSVTSGRDGSRSFRGDHDDRWSGNSSKGAYGRGGRGNLRGNNRGRYRHFNPGTSRYRNRPGGAREDDDDGDISMAGEIANRNQSRGHFNSSNNNQIRGGYRGRNNSNRRSNRGYSGPSGNYRRPEPWYKVMVPYSSNMSREDLYGLITSELQGPFEPVSYSTEGTRVYFYLKGNPMADSVRGISRRITKPDGHKLVFHVSPSEAPKENTIDEKTVEKLKLRMSARYDPSTQLLNLSAFYMDEGLQKENIFLPLNRASTMAAITKIIGEHIPELSGLDVSKNKILSVGHMSDLVKAAPNVVSLNLGENQIRVLDELDKLKGWTNITELVLDGNDLCNSFTNEGAYISAVRKKFPKVIKLDRKDLPPPITFDLENIVNLPATKGSYFGNDEVQKLIVLFVKEYFTIYDSDKRRELVPAYHENAQFSLFVAKNPLFDRQAGFSNFFEESRNLKKIGHFDSDKLAKKIKTGVLSVVSCLEALPKTTHDLNSFIVDVSLASPTMMCFILHGIFKENEGRSDRPVFRSFSRTFITVPSGPGMVIINDMLSISNASPEQTKNAFKSAAPTPSSSPVPSSQIVAGPSSSQTSAAGPFLTPTQIQMVETFSAQSGMNAQFTLKCLQENAWDYQRAGQVFTDLNAQGKIPVEAFVKIEH